MKPEHRGETLFLKSGLIIMAIGFQNAGKFSLLTAFTNVAQKYNYFHHAAYF